MATSSLSLRDRRLTAACASGGSQDHLPIQYCLPQTHPSEVLRHIKHWGGGCLARPSANGSQPGLAAPLATVLLKNLKGKIKNSDLDLAALVLHKATPLVTLTEARMAAPRSGSDNNPTVSWSTREASVINPVAVDLLNIHAIQSRYFS